MERASIKTERFTVEVDTILTQFVHANFEDRQKAIQAGAEFIKEQLEQSSPKKTGDYSRSWVINDKYPDHRYVKNTKTVNGKEKTRTVNGKVKGGRYRTGIPLVKILEYSEKYGKKHMGATFNACKQQIINVIKNKLNGG
jgi:hypothetical protein